MRLEKASYKAVKYACMNFHYAKRIPLVAIGYSVFNNKNEWCGVIAYGYGSGANLGKPYNLKHGEYLELTRMALNGKQESTSKAMAISIKLLKKVAPLVKLLISYADKKQNHLGIIYQATNWYFVDETESSGTEVLIDGTWVHNRKANEMPKKVRDRLTFRKKEGKIKYIYPLMKEIVEMCNKLSKPYLKKHASIA